MKLKTILGVLLIMGTNSLPKLAAAPTKVAATTTQYNAAVDAMQGHLVMRDSAGAVEDGVSDIGRPSSGRPRKVYVGTGLNVAGQDIDFSAIALQTTGVSSGLSKASGFPQFLEPGDETGAGGSHIVRILAANTPLEMTIDGQAYMLETDLESGTLALAPGSNNTCLVADANIVADPVWSKTIGEFGYWITVDAIGSEIAALTGTTQCFKITNGSETEVFIAEVEVDNTGTETNRLIPILRGIGGTNRIAFTDNDTITLLKAHYIFLDNDLATIDTTVNYPTWSAAEPDAPVEGDYWWDIANETWKRYSAAAEWEALGRIYLGYAIADASGVEWAEHVDFNLAWDSKIEFPIGHVAASTSYKIEGGLIVNVCGKKIIFPKGILLNASSDYMPGESFPSGGFSYVYLDKYGNQYLSNIAPREFNEKNGAYHPKEYYRCVSVIYFSSSALVGSTHIPNLKTIMVNTGARLDGGGNNTYTLVNVKESFPPSVKEITLQGIMAYSAAARRENQSYKEVSQYIGFEKELADALDFTPVDSSGLHTGTFMCTINFVQNGLLYMKYLTNKFDYVYVPSFKINL
jgi:hypothetical protein